MTFDEKLNKILKHCDIINPLLIPLVRNQIKQVIAEELPDIERAHTYASENADVYRAYDKGQEDYRDRVRKRLGVK